MATLKYVIAEPVAGADKYYLYKNSTNSTTGGTQVAEQKTILDFPYRGVIGEDGKEVSRKKTLDYFYYAASPGTRAKVSGFPMRKITEAGARYYFGVSVEARIVYARGTSTWTTLTGEYYTDRTDEFEVIGDKNGNTNNAFIKSDTDGGWDLSLNIRYDSGEYSGILIRLLDADNTIADVDWIVGADTEVTIICNNEDDVSIDRRHTEYIPIDALGDGMVINSKDVCVGKFELADLNVDYPKMAFYDKNLKFVAVADSKFLNQWKAGAAQGNANNELFYDYNGFTYFTVAGIVDIADGVWSNAVEKEGSTITVENKPVYVVFSSKHPQGMPNDNVSVPGSYFPLFAMRDKFGTGTHYVYAYADSDAFHLKMSPASNIEEYVVG